MEKIPVNSPWARVPQCGCDPGHGPAPTKLKMLECKLRGGPCQKSNKPDIPNIKRDETANELMDAMSDRGKGAP